MIDYLPEVIFIFALLLIGVTLLVGTFKRWRWLIDPSPKRWWYYPPSTLNRFFGSNFLVVISYCIGLLFFALAVLACYDGLKCIYYETHYNLPSSEVPGLKMYTGVSVETLEACLDDSEKLLKINKMGDEFNIRIRDIFPCHRQQKRPYLSIGADNKYTLVLSSKYPLLSAWTNCDCTIDMTIKIKHRLQSGATLKVLSDGGVLGHLIVP